MLSVLKTKQSAIKKKKKELGRYNNCYNIEKSNGNYIIKLLSN